ncbi:hypothetical protein ACFLYE_04465 [Chloroflexota bacterium]
MKRQRVGGGFSRGEEYALDERGTCSQMMPQNKRLVTGFAARYPGISVVRLGNHD